MDYLPAILSALGGGTGMFLLKFISDLNKTKREDSKEVVGAWQHIADRETQRLERLEERVTILEKAVLEKDHYIRYLEHEILQHGLTPPDNLPYRDLFKNP
ncbi:MAG: hypothetical protein LBH71_01590 [Oscillospiraceae bacterium]|jgi:tRNA A37 N6-isopentenylltransferase MiaA|nr:hypothetical protein [Oscillospiraceae bacterium]